MFWKFGGYASISPIDSILDRPQFTLEDLLDENDLLGDIKARNGKLLDYLRQREALERLLEFVVAPKAEPANEPVGDETKADSTSAGDDASNERGRPRLLPFSRPRASSSLTDGGRDDDETETKRNRYAYVSCEILSCDNWSICETVMDPSNRDLLHKFWQYIKQPALLDPLQASYFTKVNESLFDKKVDDMVAFLKSADGAVQDMLRHVDCPMIMDLLLKIITLDRPEGSPGIVEVSNSCANGQAHKRNVPNANCPPLSSGSIRKMSCQPFFPSSVLRTAGQHRLRLEISSRLSSLSLPTPPRTSRHALAQMNLPGSLFPTHASTS